jgi:hypothetical protein
VKFNVNPVLSKHLSAAVPWRPREANFNAASLLLHCKHTGEQEHEQELQDVVTLPLLQLHLCAIVSLNRSGPGTWFVSCFAAANS